MLLRESRAALDSLAETLPLLAPLGGVDDLEPLCGQLRKQLERDHTVVVVAGPRRGDVIETLVGASILAADPAPSVTARLRAAPELTYHVRWSDGRVELPPLDRSDELAAELARFERIMAAETERARTLEERLRESRQPRLEPPRPAAPASRNPLRVLFAWLLGVVLRLFGRVPRALPADELAEARTRRALAAPTVEAPTALADELARLNMHLLSLTEERTRRREQHDAHRADRLHGMRARLIAITADVAQPPVEIEIGAPGIPDGVTLLLRPPVDIWRELADASVMATERLSADELREKIRGADARRPADIARRIIAVSCSVHNRIIDRERRARQTHDERMRELTAQPDSAVAPDEHLAAAQLPLARGAQEIVDDAASQLERLVEDVRKGWEQRIDGCAGAEQLRAELAAIEDGAVHRLSLLCDELRETMTVRFVRLVLELSRPLRQELSRRRAELARGRSTRIEEAFEDIRFVFPAALDGAFAALRAPAIGELMPREHRLWDSLFRSLAREKRECLSRLGAQLDEIQQATARELYASTVYISPLLVTTLRRLLEEMLVVQQRWIEARVSEEQRAYDELRTKYALAMEQLAPLEQLEARLAARLERAAGR